MKNILEDKEIYKERFEVFIQKIGQNKASIARLLNIKPQALDSALKSAKGLITYADALYNLGLNYNWYLTGKGSMFSDSIEGRKFASLIREPEIPYQSDDKKDTKTALYKSLKAFFDTL
jgi:hypothetical protein